MKRKRKEVDFCHHRCKLSINIIGQSKERKNRQRGLGVCMSSEVKELFFSVCLSVFFSLSFCLSFSLISFLPFSRKKTQSTEIIAYFNRLLFFALAISSLLKLNPSFLSFLFFSSYFLLLKKRT